jgi:hypothetical protein
MSVNDDYGRKIGMALQAVHQMHVDVTKLISLLDKEIGRSPIRPNITDQAHFVIAGPVWMPEGMHRIYAVPTTPGRVEGVTAVFFDHWGQRIDEPRLLVGHAQFTYQQAEDMTRGDEWCLWHAYLEWQDRRPINKVLLIKAPSENDFEKLSWVRLIAVPLYSIGGIKDVMDLLQQTRMEACN